MIRIMERHYFDWAATAIPDCTSTLQKSEAAHCFANPSSIHEEGRAARKVLEEARSRCAKALAVKTEEVFFTSGGTESNAIVLFSQFCKPNRSVFLYSAVEHPSIRENAATNNNATPLERFGISCAAIGVEKDGRVSEATLEKALEKNPGARMAAIMAVNNETGAVNEIKKLSAVLRKRQKQPVHLHCDIVQAAGKIPLDLDDWGIDSASLSAHKIGGSRGIGILWLKKTITPLLRGTQEKGIRPGTENTQGAIELAQALEKYAAPLHNNGSLPSFYSEAEARMKTLIAGLRNTGFFIPIPEDRCEEDSRFSPWILQAAFRNKAGKIIPGEVMARALDEKGFAISTGSACSSRETKRPVLEAMGMDKETSRGGIRISQGWSTTMEEINFLVDTITMLLNSL